MPELPEVEVSARVARRALESREVIDVDLTPCKLFRLPRARYLNGDATLPAGAKLLIEVDDLKEHLIGAQAYGVLTSRHGKLMAFHLLTQDQRALTIFSRLGMTGKYVRESITSTSRSPASRSSERSGVKLTLVTRPISGQRDTPERLVFINTRMFGAVWGICSAPLQDLQRFDEVAQAHFAVEVKSSEMGPDALELAARPDAWIKRVRQSSPRRAIKTLLLDQKSIAGVGNIYAAEGIFHAQAHPLTPIKDLSDQQLELIATGVSEAMYYTLKHADGGHEVIYGSARGAQSPFAVYGREGLECLRCSASLVNLQISGRATVYCPQCQPQP